MDFFDPLVSSPRPATASSRPASSDASSSARGGGLGGLPPSIRGSPAVGEVWRAENVSRKNDRRRRFFFGFPVVSPGGVPPVTCLELRGRCTTPGAGGGSSISATITIDAMSCQRAIAEQIIDGGGHYAPAVKDNQPTLSENIRTFFDDAQRLTRPLDDPPPVVEKAREPDAGHGRVEETSAQDLHPSAHDPRRRVPGRERRGQHRAVRRHPRLSFPDADRGGDLFALRRSAAERGTARASHDSPPRRRLRAPRPMRAACSPTHEARLPGSADVPAPTSRAGSETSRALRSV